jgi:toxin CcdB
MARFDLHRARDGGGFVLNVQHDLHDHLATGIVVPLLPEAAAPPPSRDLNPVFEIEGVRHILFPQYLAAVPERELGRPLGTLEPQRDAVTRALDLLLTGI